MNPKTLVCTIDQLEPRTLFSAPYEFAAVGLRFDASAGPSVFEMLGTLAADGGVTGTQTFAQRTGSPISGPIDFASFQLLSNGRFLSAPRTGVDPYASQFGDNFIGERGYPFGSLFAEFANDGPTDIAFLLQRVVDHELEWGGIDHHQFQYLEFSADGFSIHAGEFHLFNTQGAVSWSDAVDGSNPHSIGVVSQDQFGSLTLADGRVLHTNIAPYPFVGMIGGPYPPGQITLIVDTDNSDGKIGIGIARKNQDAVTFAATGMFGMYRTTILTGGPLGQEFFDATALPGGLASARVAIELGMNRRYTVYPLEGYDNGQRVAISTGEWVEDSGERSSTVLLIRDGDHTFATLIATDDYALVPWYVAAEGEAGREQIIGGAVAFTPAAFDREIFGGHVALDDNGHPIFHLTTIVDPYADPPRASQWYNEDLIELWGGKPLVAVDSIFSTSFAYLVVGVATDGDVLTWERSFTGRWAFRNVTENLLGASPIVSDLTIFSHAGLDGSFVGGDYRALAVAGKAADGDLILYTPNLVVDPYRFHSWNVVNVTEIGLNPNGQPTPQWTGAIQGYQTSWNGLNIVGIDATGDLIVAWTAPGLPDGGWLTTNLSDLAGTPPMVGSISVLMTLWDGIHIHALDADGNLHSTWWVPELGGGWEHVNLTADLGGPPLDTTRNTDRTEAFTTFIGVGNSLNIVGYDANGRVRVYWWSPENNFWLVGDITDSFPPSEAPLGFSGADLLGSTDPDGTYWQSGQSLYGYNADGSFSRVWWAANGTDVWHVENLTEQAIPIVS